MVKLPGDSTKRIKASTGRRSLAQGEALGYKGAKEIIKRQRCEII